MNIDILLKNRKMTKVQLAQKMGISREYLYKLIAGEPTDDVIQKIATAIGESVITVKSLIKESSGISEPEKIRCIFLPMEECKIVRQIIIIAPTEWGQETEVGYIMYSRPITENYKMNLSGQGDPISYLLNSHKEEYYPKDYVDEVLLKMIKDTYPKSIVKYSIVLTNTDEVRIKSLQVPMNKKVTMTLSPLLMPEHYNVPRNFYYLRQDITLYAAWLPALIEPINGFISSFSLDKENEVFNTIDNVHLIFL